MALKIRCKDRMNINKEEALKEVMAEKGTTLTIQLPETLKENCKIKALKNKTTLTNIIINSLKEYTNVN